MRMISGNRPSGDHDVQVGRLRNPPSPSLFTSKHNLKKSKTPDIVKYGSLNKYIHIVKIQYCGVRFPLQVKQIEVTKAGKFSGKEKDYLHEGL